MDSLQEVSSTMAEDSEVLIEIEVSQPQNGISLAEAANALITLQVPSKEPTPLISCSKTGDTSDSKPVVAEGNPKDVRKRILEGMKSQFNTSNEEEAGLEQSNRRGPHRSKSKFKRQNYENEDDSLLEVVIKQETPKISRGRGRPPRISQVEKPPQQAVSDTLKIEPEIIRSEIDSSSEAGSERSDSASGTISMMTTRRSQRTNISRTSATELLKGLAETRPIKKATSSEPELVKPLDLPRKRGRPCKITVVYEAKSTETVEEATEETIVEDVSKVVHMASLGLQSKLSPDQSTTTVYPPETSPVLNTPNLLRESRPTSKKLRVDGFPTKDTSPEKESVQSFSLSLDESPSSVSVALETSAQTPVKNISLTDESNLVANSLENEVELSIVEVQGKQEASNGPMSRQVNGTVSLIIEKSIYSCTCVESRPPVVPVAPPVATLYCQAVDSVGGKLVGCCLAANRKRFYRPSKKIPFMILCDSHRDRIRKHFCCPGCGLFCTQVSVLCF